MIVAALTRRNQLGNQGIAGITSVWGLLRSRTTYARYHRYYRATESGWGLHQGSGPEIDVIEQLGVFVYHIQNQPVSQSYRLYICDDQGGFE